MKVSTYAAMLMHNNTSDRGFVIDTFRSGSVRACARSILARDASFMSKALMARDTLSLNESNA